MRRLRAVLNQRTEPGLYRWRGRTEPATVEMLVGRHGWRFFYLDGRFIRGKVSFLRAAAPAFSLPGYFGYNWDAFEECITDLAWAPAPGYVLLYDHAGNFAAGQPEEFATLYSILVQSVGEWRQQGTPFYVLFRHAGRTLAQAPWL